MSNALPQQSDIVAAIMAGLGGIAAIPPFTPTNQDLCLLAESIMAVKAAANKWNQGTGKQVANCTVDAYTACSAYRTLSAYAKNSNYAITGANQYYYLAYLRQSVTAFKTAKQSSSKAVDDTGLVLGAMMAAIGQLATAATSVQAKEKALQKEIQTLEKSVAQVQQTLEKQRKTERSWWFQLINFDTAGIADDIFHLVTNISGLQNQLGPDEKELAEDINNFKIYQTTAPLAGMCSQLVLGLQQWALGFYDTNGQMQALFDSVEIRLQPATDPEFIQQKFQQMDETVVTIQQAIEKLESFQSWAKSSQEISKKVYTDFLRDIIGSAANNN